MPKKRKAKPARQRRIVAVGIDGAACKELLLDARAIVTDDLHCVGDFRLAYAELQQNLCFLLVGIRGRARWWRRVMAYRTIIQERAAFDPRPAHIPRHA